MLLPDREDEVSTEPSPPREASSIVAGPHFDLLSPSLVGHVGEQAVAYELKFLVPEALALTIQHWAMSRMQPDAFAHLSREGSYQTTTLYLDTPERDVLHRTAKYRRRKFRVRRYGVEPLIYLERKTRRGDRVRKRRSDLALAQIHCLNHAADASEWSGSWFQRRIQLRGLRPASRVTYDRTAFVQRTDDGPIRMTFDRHIRGAVTDEWNLTPVEGSPCILPDYAVCELKFRHALPQLFKEALQTFVMEPGGFSKYRRIMLGDDSARRNGVT